MSTKRLLMCAAGAGLLALAATSAGAQQAAPAGNSAAEFSDAGVVAGVPYDLDPRLKLRPESKMALRKLEDRHIQEHRELEDRYDQEVRALRAKQYSERLTFIKSLGGR